MPDDPTPPPSQLLRLAEAAEFLRIPPRKMRKLADAGAVPCIRISLRHTLFEEADLREFIESMRVGSR